MIGLEEFQWKGHSLGTAIHGGFDRVVSFYHRLSLPIKQPRGLDTPALWLEGGIRYNDALTIHRPRRFRYKGIKAAE